jgi:hypothetical protein
MSKELVEIADLDIEFRPLGLKLALILRRLRHDSPRRIVPCYKTLRNPVEKGLFSRM